jgi:hypothetical protein
MNGSAGWSKSSSGCRCCLGIFSAKGVLSLEFKPAYSVGDLLTQHLEELKQEADRNGGALQTLSDHFTKVYMMVMPPAA